MDRAKYNACMGQHMRSVKPKDQAERRLEFCVGARLCSGKVKTREEALRSCHERALQKPTTPRGRKVSPKKLYQAFMETAEQCNCGELQRIAQEMIQSASP